MRTGWWSGWRAREAPTCSRSSRTATARRSSRACRQCHDRPTMRRPLLTAPAFSRSFPRRPGERAAPSSHRSWRLTGSSAPYLLKFVRATNDRKGFKRSSPSSRLNWRACSRQPPAAPTRSRDNRRRLSQAAEKRSLNLQVSSFKSQLPRIWPDFGGSDLSLVTLKLQVAGFFSNLQPASLEHFGGIRFASGDADARSVLACSVRSVVRDHRGLNTGGRRPV